MNSDVRRTLARAMRASAEDARSMPARTGNPKLDALSSGLYFAREARDYLEKAKAYYRKQTTYTVTIEESDTAFSTVQQWLLDILPEKRQHNVTASTKTVYLDADGSEMVPRVLFDEYGDSNSKVSETRVVLSLSETVPQDIFIGGHKVRVQVVSGQLDDGAQEARARRGMQLRNGKILFMCRSVAAQDAVVEHLNGMVGGRNKRKPALWVADGWGNWRSQDAPARKISSVILRPGLMEDIRGDLEKFLADERKYTDLGIPWHRGYLFHGPAGTGKTSLIKALAADLGLDLWYAPLGDLKEDSSLVDLIRSVKPRGILLLEDVDAYAAARDREDEPDGGKNEFGSGITTSALLNALDGVVTPHGLITIMTTNHLDKLDPALVRNGRADRVIKLDLPTMTEIYELWNMFFPNEDSSWIPQGTWTPGPSQASVSEVFKRHWEDPQAARDELNRILSDAAEEVGGSRSDATV